MSSSPRSSRLLTPTSDANSRSRRARIPVNRDRYVDSSEIHDSDPSEEEQEDWSDDEFVDLEEKKRKRSKSSEEDDDDEGVDEDSQPKKSKKKAGSGSKSKSGGSKSKPKSDPKTKASTSSSSRSKVKSGFSAGLKKTVSIEINNTSKSKPGLLLPKSTSKVPSATAGKSKNTLSTSGKIVKPTKGSKDSAAEEEEKGQREDSEEKGDSEEEKSDGHEQSELEASCLSQFHRHEADDKAQEDEDEDQKAPLERIEEEQDDGEDEKDSIIAEKAIAKKAKSSKSKKTQKKNEDDNDNDDELPKPEIPDKASTKASLKKATPKKNTKYTKGTKIEEGKDDKDEDDTETSPAPSPPIIEKKNTNPKAPDAAKKLRAGGIKLPAVTPKQAIAIGVKPKNRRSGFPGLQQKVPADPVGKPKVAAKGQEAGEKVAGKKKVIAITADSDEDEAEAEQEVIEGDEEKDEE